MPSLLLESLPRAVGCAKDRNASVPISGILVHDAAFVRALLDFGSFDRYYFIESPYYRSDFSDADVSSRLVPIKLGESRQLADVEELILFRSGTDLSPFVPFRRQYENRSWPICGLTHGLSDISDTARYLMASMLSLESYDGVICTSVAAQIALRAIFSNLSASHALNRAIQPPPVMMPVIPLGVDRTGSIPKKIARDTVGLPRNGFYCLYIGRLSPINKCDLRAQIAAFLSIRNLPENACFVIAGDDTDLNWASELECLAHALGGSTRIRIFPNISTSQKTALLSACDIFVSLSDTYSETFGITIVEAMDAGLPVVAADWSGYRDIVEDGITGFLIPTIGPRSDPLSAAWCSLSDLRLFQAQQIALDWQIFEERVVGLYRAPELVESLGKSAKARVNAQYRWNSVIPRLEAFWREQLRLARQTAGRARHHSQGEPGFYDMSRAFAHYVTATLPGDATLMVAENAANGLAALDYVNQKARKAIGPFRPEIDSGILDSVRRHRHLPLGNILALYPDSDSAFIQAHVLRLMKYGVLRIIE
jgi:glycosyltransferase involved in cell wall biosynthesis